MNEADQGRQTQELRDEIDHIRADLGETVQELATRADVPARMKAATGRATDRAKQASRQATDRAKQATQRAKQNPAPWLALAGGVIMVVAIVLVVRGRRR